MSANINKQVLVTESGAVAETVRRTLMDEFKKFRPWVCVERKLGSEQRTITVVGPWGTPLPEEQFTQIQEFVSAMTKGSPKIDTTTPPVSN